MKTAYEMRISDWSSDVCSSDLEGRGIRLGYVVANPRPCDGEPQILIDLLALEQVLKSAGQMLTDSLQIDRGTALRAVDRKSVVEGTSVTGSVDLVGRRIIKKTNKKRLTRELKS